jgi:hypothetical protein
MYKTFDISYDKESLLALYNQHKDGDAVLKGGFHELDFDEILENPEVLRLFDILEIFGAPHVGTVAFNSVTKTSGPHVLPSCNGMIIFPIVGSFVTKFYSYKVPLVRGRPHLQGPLEDPSMQLALMDSFVDEVVVDKPTVIDGLCPHQDYMSNDECVFLCFKIPMHIDWNTITQFIDSLEG